MNVGYEKVKHILQESNVIAKEQAVRSYYNNPNYCLFCNKMILIKEGQKARDARIKKFCNQSCAAKENNKKRDNGTPQLRTFYFKKRDKIVKCKKCKDSFKASRTNSGVYSNSLYCRKCKKYKIDLNKISKESLFRRYDKWQTARSQIQRNARKIFWKSDKYKECVVCGYKKHVEVSHVRDVSDFPGETLIEDINHIDNLIGLCPTHHWEFDTHNLDPEDKKKIDDLLN